MGVRLALGRVTLANLWDRLADAYGGRVAFTLEEPVWLGPLRSNTVTYADAAAAAARIARVLMEAGAGPGKRVAICGANRIDYALTVCAAVRAGAVAVPLHHHLKPAELASMAKHARADLLVADTAVELPGVRVLHSGHGGDLDVDVRPFGPVGLGREDPAVILYTSGTTGKPKGATLTSRSLLAVARLASLAPVRLLEDRGGICGLPLAHVMGLSTLLCAALAGTRLHWLSKFEPEVVLRRIEELQPGFFVGVPAMYQLLAASRPERFDLSSIKLFASGADAMPPALAERFARLGCSGRLPSGAPLLTAAFAEIYGMVELSGPAIVKVTPARPVEGLRTARLLKRIRGAAPGEPAPGGRRQAVTRERHSRRETGDLPPADPGYGFPIPPYRARIVDEQGAQAPAGEVGELVLRGPGVMKGYEAGAGLDAEGWLHTGDLARQTRLGLIQFVTRKKDVVKHGGFSVFPAEVEAQLCEHPAVAEAVVLGMPHPLKGAVPVAVVVLKGRASEPELKAWAREHIAPYKSPRAVVAVAASELPRNANKKVLKDELREQVRARLEAQLRE